jgi:hypothetical protein
MATTTSTTIAPDGFYQATQTASNYGYVFPSSVVSGELYSYSVVPDSGFFGINWPASGSIPTSFSSAGWSLKDRGFVQQTFLGASIRSFSVNGGFGDTSSTLSVELVNDEYNKSDRIGFGDGDDPYHNGVSDFFSPPPVGSPVFFKFGMNFATIPEAYRATFDYLYKINTFPPFSDVNYSNPFSPLDFFSLGNNQFVDFSFPPEGSGTYADISTYLSGPNKGKYHTVFGGILQSYVQNKGPGGSPVFSAQVTDPREILSNVVLILNNYTGTVFNRQNMINIYGFLEYNLSDSALNFIKTNLPVENILTKNVLPSGGTFFTGNDTYSNIPLTTTTTTPAPPYNRNTTPAPNPNSFPVTPIIFPMTGSGFSRRGPQGIPYYRVKQALNALMQYSMELPQEYKEKGFGGVINFRGFNYVVDFGSLPDIPDLYYFDFDQMTMLELALEICDITSHDLFVSLLPVINHPACSFIYSWNQTHLRDPSKFISGIIRLDAINRSKAPQYGAIKYYIDSLAYYGIHTENQDVGFELSNITTDKFVVGAQEVDMHYFSSNADRNNLDTEGIGEQWKLERSLKQQILPYYGLLGNRAVTIPRGYGAYQQILLDSTGLGANGVGSYYVATEMELRCALISFERWKEFLKLYNDVYMESVEDNDAEDSAALLQSAAPPGFPPVDSISDNYAVTVPRSVFQTYAEEPFGSDELPSSPCNPPYGYPLYYKRMTKIGIPEGGLVEIQSRFTSLITGLASLGSVDKTNFKHVLNSEINRIKELLSTGKKLNQAEANYLAMLENLLDRAEKAKPSDIANMITLMEESVENFKPLFFSPDMSKLAKRNLENAMKVYNFVKSVAEECLGKKFLVKLPKVVNPFFDARIKRLGEGSPDSRQPVTKEYIQGPFGFKPRPITSGVGYEFLSNNIQAFITQMRANAAGKNMMEFMLDSGTYNYKLVGELNVAFNPIIDQYESNYVPVNEGGFFNFDLYRNVISNDSTKNLNASGYQLLPLGVQNQLIPIDLTNFISDNGRISAYVRFDHSENLSFEGFSSSDFTQQVITANGSIPDISNNLDNAGVDKFYSFPQDNATTTTQPPQLAYVKCQVDEKLYMTPKSSYQKCKVYGQRVVDTKNLKLPRKIYEPCEDKYLDSFSYYYSNFTPTTYAVKEVRKLELNASSGIPVENNNLIKGKFINTQLGDLDTSNVYALITLPGRVIPTKDARFRDGPFQSCNAEKFKHYMTMDTVKGLEGFDVPAFLGNPPKSILKIFNEETIPIDNRVHAFLAARKSNDSLISFGLPQLINYTSPSPVYPSLVALPLMSKDRCYGPWVSSQINTNYAIYSNIGGKIDFLKDENLSPWNYCGYDLMNTAGRLQAQFSNSTMLASERGGFVIPFVPLGLSIGTALINAGPIITNIQVDVSDAGVRTTYKLDSYTASFGKLQKQKQDAIATISRERQKLKDEKNSLIRKGLIKKFNNTNYLKQYENLNNSINASMIANNAPVAGIAMQSKVYENRAYSLSEQSPHTNSLYTVDGSFVSHQDLTNVASNYIGEDGFASSYQNSASSSVSDMYAPASNEPFHPTMAFRPDPNKNASKYLYFDKDTPFKPDEVV